MYRSMAAGLALMLLGPSIAVATFKPEYAAAPQEIQDWFRTLRSPGGGLCCDLSDGHKVEDIEWGTTGDATEPFWVVIDGQRVSVPVSRVVPGANRVGPALVWPMYQDGKPIVRCFMPGALG